jgi:hypothetical protein
LPSKKAALCRVVNARRPAKRHRNVLTIYQSFTLFGQSRAAMKEGANHDRNIVANFHCVDRMGDHMRPHHERVVQSGSDEFHRRRRILALTGDIRSAI